MLSDSANAAISGVKPERVDTASAVPWLQGRDVFVTALLVTFWLLSLCLPERRWPGLARWFAQRRLANSARLSSDELETVKVVVGHGEGKSAWIEETFRRDWLAHKYLSWMQLLACYRPWRWRPQPKLIGRQHVDEALARGRGVILLTANFVYKDLMTKAALAGAGYGASHLSRDSHGFAESRLGKALLNPIYTGIERRFLRERLVFSGRDTKKVNELLRARLRENRPIMVTVTPLGRHVTTLPFLHGRIKIATGGLNFACEAGAQVLPVFTIRTPDGDIETIIEHPLVMETGVSNSEAIKAMLDDYVPRLETYVAQNPDQFAFPTSDRHGHALIEPRTPPVPDQARQEQSTQAPVAEVV